METFRRLFLGYLVCQLAMVIVVSPALNPGRPIPPVWSILLLGIIATLAATVGAFIGYYLGRGLGAILDKLFK